MRLNYNAASLLTIARQRDAHGPRLVITVGLLYDPVMQVLAPKQAQPWLAERFGEESFDRFLKKSRGSFAVHGTAHALHDGQRHGMSVQVSLGALRKTLYVYPPRYWKHGVLGWTMQPGDPLQSLALDLQHAYGGPEYADNPEGMGHAGAGGPVDGLALAQIEGKLVALRGPDEPQELASFLPLPMQSRERLQFMGSCDEHWQRLRAPFLPLDTDPRWFDEVAQDQCYSDYWRGDEAWSASGMHPERDTLQGRLPGLRPRLLVRRVVTEGTPEEALLDLDTVWLFPDVERVLLLYRCDIAVQDIDGEDVAALAVGCERAADPQRSTEQWAAELWPQPVVKAVVEPPPPPPAFDPAQAMAKMQAAFDAAYEHFAVQQAQVLAGAQEIAARVGKTVDDSATLKLKAPDLAALAAAPRAPAVPFDSAALKAEIEKEIAQGKEEGHRQLEQIAKHIGTDAKSLYAMAANMKPVHPDPVAMVNSLSISEAEKVKYRAQIQEAINRGHNIEAQVKAATDSVKAAIDAARPATTNLPAIKPRRVWTRELLQASHDEGEVLSRERFKELNLSGLDLRAGQFESCFFETCKLKGCCLEGADLQNCTFTDCDFTEVQLDAAKLTRSLFQRCNLNAAQLNDVSGEGLNAQTSDWNGAALERANMSRAQFSDCTMTKASFKAARFEGARWQRCDLANLQGQGTFMNNSQWHDCRIDAVDLRGSELRRASWSKTHGQAADLSECQMQGWRIDQACQFPDIRLDKSDLSGASLQFSALPRASLVEARLDSALVSRCDLTDSNGYHLSACAADFTGSNLSKASWVGANLMDVRLRKVNLQQADLSSSNLYAAFTEGVRGADVRLDGALLTGCRLQEDLANG